MWSVIHSVHLNVSKVTTVRVMLLVAGVTGDRRKDTAANTASTAEQFLFYPLEVTALKGFIGRKHVFVLRSWVFWVVTPCVWVIASRRSRL
jgi:hypothetical protein